MLKLQCARPGDARTLLVTLNLIGTLLFRLGGSILLMTLKLQCNHRCPVQSTVFIHPTITTLVGLHCNFSVSKEDQSSQSHKDSWICTAILASSRKSNSLDRLCLFNYFSFNSGWWSYLSLHPSKWCFVTWFYCHDFPFDSIVSSQYSYQA